MVFRKIKEAFSGNDDRYEALYYRYSQIKLENAKLKNKHKDELNIQKERIDFESAKNLIKIAESIEITKNDSFKVNSLDKNIQRLLIDVNTTQKLVNEMMKQLNLESISADEEKYNPEMYEIASYSDAKGMKMGMIIKTVKKGYKLNGKIIKKPRVCVTK